MIEMTDAIRKKEKYRNVRFLELFPSSNLQIDNIEILYIVS